LLPLLVAHKVRGNDIEVRRSVPRRKRPTPRASDPGKRETARPSDPETQQRERDRQVRVIREQMRDARAKTIKAKSRNDR
jgi:hypothetical protein